MSYCKGGSTAVARYMDENCKIYMKEAQAVALTPTRCHKRRIGEREQEDGALAKWFAIGMIAAFKYRGPCAAFSFRDVNAGNPTSRGVSRPDYCSVSATELPTDSRVTRARGVDTHVC
jgi:hypothetical protein